MTPLNGTRDQKSRTFLRASSKGTCDIVWAPWHHAEETINTRVHYKRRKLRLSDMLASEEDSWERSDKEKVLPLLHAGSRNFDLTKKNASCGLDTLLSTSTR